MANTLIQLKRSSVPGNTPANNSIQPGELAINLADRKLYSKDTANVVFDITMSGPQGAQGAQGAQGVDGDRYQTTSNTSYTIQAGGNSGTLIVETDLSYSAGQSIKIAYDINNIQFADVTSYYSANGQLNFNTTANTGSGTYSSWVVNLAGATGALGPQGPQGSQGNAGSLGPTGPQGAQGDTGPQGAQGAQGIQGETGAQGPQGRQGTTGSQGPQGAQGEVGAQGFQGTQGITGATGPQGPQGDTGGTGAQGPQGNTGSVGPTGPQGQQGAQGNQGAQGPQGYQGAQGNQGAQGIQGETGPQGAQGPQGYQGAQGNQGAQGAQGKDGNFGGATFDFTFDNTTIAGDPGQGKLRFNSSDLSTATVMYIDDTNDGAVDIQAFLRTIDDSTSGLKGHFRVSNRLDANDFAIFTITSITEQTGYFEVSCAYITGSTAFSNNEDIIITFARTGDRGDTGPQGAQGFQGTTGSQGAQGAQGNTGPQGAQGFQGTAGSQGAQGAQGNTGSVGPTGSQGAQGFQGSTGAQGPQGITGETGAQGPQGFQGSTGAQGPQGITGAQGNTGSQGPQGAQGNTGAQGAQGNTGSQGAQGAQGNTGAQGPQGFQGITGSQGPQGAQGNAGAQGPQGFQGTAGSTGPTGPQGAQGNQGAQGAQGQTGSQGAQGFQGALQPWTRKTTNYTAVNGDRIIADTSGGSFTITLPLTPTVGHYIQITDGNNFSGNNLTVARNGSTIDGNVDDVLLDITGVTFEFIYDGTTWEVTGTTGKEGAQGSQGSAGPQGTAGAAGATGPQGPQGALQPWTRKTSGYTAVDGDRIIADTSSGPFTITLPATPTTGSYIQITDGNDFSGNNLTVARNGSTIDGIADNVLLDIKNVTFEFIYDGTTWEVTGTTGAAGQQGAQGTSGATGAQGPQGSTGVTGAQGPQGVAGTNGSTGPQGPQGAPGTGGAASETVTFVTTNQTINWDSGFIIASNTINITLPTANTSTAYKYYIKNIGVGTITVIPQSPDTLDGYSNVQITGQNSAMGVFSDGTAWRIF